MALAETSLSFGNRYRRAPLRDLQELGGWKSLATLMEGYLRADEDARREVLTDTPARVREAVSE